MQSTSLSKKEQVDSMKAYYSFHAKIYDLSRWTFLFGRKSIIQNLKAVAPESRSILEVGCGTGYNLERLAKAFPKAKIIGMDVSAQMLAKAKERLEAYDAQISLQEKPYQLDTTSHLGKLDLILFSYSLSMINPQWEELLRQAFSDLRPGGLIALVDFYDSPFPWFKRHMKNNHVRMDSHIMPVLKDLFQTEFEEINPAYLGVWKYFSFIGIKS